MRKPCCVWGRGRLRSYACSCLINVDAQALSVMPRLGATACTATLHLSMANMRCCAVVQCKCNPLR